MVAFFLDMEKVTVYIDGFNFYYGLRTKRRIESAWAKAYWVDLVKFFEMFLGEGQELVKVVYFTASPLNVEKSSRQSSFLNANKLLNGDRFEIVRGKYLEKKIICPNCKYTIIRPEEKKTDVNISIRMIADCFQEKTDALILVSGDSDLLPPIEFIQKNYPKKKIKVHFPPTIYSHNIESNMKGHKSKVVLLEKSLNKFANCQMPDSVSANGKCYTIPSKWKARLEYMGINPE